MSRRYEAEGRTIHPLALAELGEEVCIVALGVARDLRSGAIPPEHFNMEETCGVACCIAGHIDRRMNRPPKFTYRNSLVKMVMAGGLFAGGPRSDPILAADAIERFVYEGAQKPWEVASNGN